MFFNIKYLYLFRKMLDPLIPQLTFIKSSLN